LAKKTSLLKRTPKSNTVAVLFKHQINIHLSQQAKINQFCLPLAAQDALCPRKSTCNLSGNPLLSTIGFYTG
jgi:hypothetical protein